MGYITPESSREEQYRREIRDADDAARAERTRDHYDELCNAAPVDALLRISPFGAEHPLPLRHIGGRLNAEMATAYLAGDRKAFCEARATLRLIDGHLRGVKLGKDILCGLNSCGHGG